MRKIVLIVGGIAAAVLLNISGVLSAHGGGWGSQGMMGPCSGMMGPGMMWRQMGGHGMTNPPMMGAMMMGRGCRMMMGGWASNSQQGPWKDLRYDAYGRLLKPLTKDQAEDIVRFQLEWLGNPRLKVGKTAELEDAFKVPVVTKEGSVVYELLVDKETGAVHEPIDSVD